FIPHVRLVGDGYLDIHVDFCRVPYAWSPFGQVTPIYQTLAGNMSGFLLGGEMTMANPSTTNNPTSPGGLLRMQNGVGVSIHTFHEKWSNETEIKVKLLA